MSASQSMVRLTTEQLELQVVGEKLENERRKLNNDLLKVNIQFQKAQLKQFTGAVNRKNKKQKGAK